MDKLCHNLTYLCGRFEVSLLSSTRSRHQNLSIPVRIGIKSFILERTFHNEYRETIWTVYSRYCNTLKVPHHNQYYTHYTHYTPKYITVHTYVHISKFFDGTAMMVLIWWCMVLVLSGIEWYVVKCLMIIFISILHHHQLVRCSTTQENTLLNPSTDISTSCIYYLFIYRVYVLYYMVMKTWW